MGRITPGGAAKIHESVMNRLTQNKEWYHIFVGYVDSGWGEGNIGVLTLGPGKDPSLITEEEKAEGYSGWPYLMSLDHTPTDEEKDIIREEWEATHEYESS